MSLHEIDRAATERRIQAVAADGLRALGELAGQSAELDERMRRPHTDDPAGDGQPDEDEDLSGRTWMR